jgi:hypothetical protein
MKKLIIAGGMQKKNALRKEEWHQYEKGLILLFDFETNSISKCMEYISPADACPAEDPSIIFTAGSINNNRLYICTKTEILIYRVDDFKLKGYISLPCFNDVHHVIPTSNSSLIIANTGLDMVVVVNEEGEILKEWNVLGNDPWDKYSMDIDYRKIITTKPHESHPNYVFMIENDIWVTRFEQKDAVCITDMNKRINIGVEKPHDGNVFNGLIYFTTVDGHIVIANKATFEIEEIINLNEIDKKDKNLGWCRGLLIEKGKVWVGFSRLRPTKFRENLSWLRHGFEKVGVFNTLPTRIAYYDIENKKLLREINLEEYGLNAIFSILAIH